MARLGLTLVVLGGVAGAALWASRASAQTPPSPEPGTEPGDGQDGTSGPDGGGTADGGSSTGVGPLTSGVALAWSTASVVLNDLPDPYNPALPRRGNVTAVFDKDSATALAWQGIKTAAAATGGGGAVLAFGVQLLNIIDENWNYGSGGYEKLTPLQRKRAVVLGCDRPGDPRALPKPTPGEADYPAKMLAYCRRYLVQFGRYLEWDRITTTPDEPFLPVALIQQLIDSKLWPPPIEPPDPFGYTFFPVSDVPTRVVLPQRLSMRPEDEPIWRTAYEQLSVEYAERARVFAAVMAAVSWPAPVVELARKYGSLPRRGSPALPLIASDPNKGGL